MGKNIENLALLDFGRSPSGWPSIKKAGETSVMIVDDDRHILEMLTRFLTRFYDFKITKAGNAFEALKALEGKNIHVVITDFQIPGMDGLVLASAIKKRFPDTTIILLTGAEKEELTGNKDLENIDLFIQKPFKMKMFLNTIQEIVKNREQRSGLLLGF